MSYLKFTLALVLVICTTNSVQSWDIGVVTAAQIQFFSDKTVKTSTAVPLKDMGVATFDPIKKDVYVSDASHKVGSIFRIKTTGDTAYNVIEPIVAKQAAIVQGMAFDHHTSMLYWTTGNDKTINFVHVPENTTEDLLTGQVLLRFEVEIPQGIAIDTCRGFLYWTNCNYLNATIERSRPNGSDRKVMVWKNLFQPLGIALDVEKNRMYWNGEHEGMYYSIESSDLDGGSRKTLIQGTHHQPFAIALNDRYIYWGDWLNNAVWAIPKDSFQSKVSPTIAAKFSSINTPMGLITPPYGNTTLVNDTHSCERYRVEINRSSSRHETVSYILIILFNFFFYVIN